LLQLPKGFSLKGKEGEFFVYEKIEQGNFKPMDIKVSVQLTEHEPNEKRYQINFEYGDQDFHNSFLVIHYKGESGELFINGEKKGDNFYTGQTWEIGLKQFHYPK